MVSKNDGIVKVLYHRDHIDNYFEVSECFLEDELTEELDLNVEELLNTMIYMINVGSDTHNKRIFTVKNGTWYDINYCLKFEETKSAYFDKRRMHVTVTKHT